MFSCKTRSAKFTKATGRTLAVLALAGLTTASLGAGAADKDWGRGKDKDRGSWGHDNGRWHSNVGISVHIGTPPVVIASRPRVIYTQPVVISRPVVRTYADVMPEKLSFKAYQSQDRVIVLVEGSNCGTGYTTTLTALEHGWGTPTLVLRNTPTCDEHGYGSSPFCLNAAICSPQALSCLKVRVAGQTIDVPVTAVQTIS